MSNIRRQYWFGDHWLSMWLQRSGQLGAGASGRPGDAILRVRDFRALSHLPASSPRGTTKRFRTRPASWPPTAQRRPGRRGVSPTGP
ncbi:MAG: hypothetical protein ACLSHC_01420 [Bilophila wadsworthia]